MRPRRNEDLERTHLSWSRCSKIDMCDYLLLKAASRVDDSQEEQLRGHNKVYILVSFWVSLIVY